MPFVYYADLVADCSDESPDCAENVIDCAGECGGSAVVDACGVCGGDGLSCTSTIDYCLSLHTGANLKSFYGLQEDASIANVMSSLGVNVTGVITEGGASSQNTPGNWVGSISNILPVKGYWIVVSNADSLCITEAEPIDPALVYNLHFGANLISFPIEGSALVGDALPDDIESSVSGIITEGGAVSQIAEGTWVGSISSLNGGKGYWVITTEGITFSFNLE